MVNLISQSSIDNLKIDTVERAIVFAVNALQIAISKVDDNNSLRNKVKTTVRPSGKDELILRIDAILPLNLYIFGKSGGNLLESIDIFDINYVINVLSDFSFTNIEPSEPIDTSFPVPRNIESFEKYLFYYASILAASLSENRNRIISFAPKTNNFDNPEIKLTINLPINSNQWFSNVPLLGCVKRVVNSYSTDAISGLTGKNISILSDGFVLNNETLLIN